MKIFITGATGFIGRSVIRRLAGTQHEIHCLVRKTSDISFLTGYEVQPVYGDITDRVSLAAGMHGCDWVINLAALYSFWVRDPREYSRMNIDGTQNLMECALEEGIRKVVHVSTALIYGRPDAYPFQEDSPVGPERFSEYARTKYAGDEIAWSLYREKGLPLVVIYPGGVMGPDHARLGTNQYISDIIEQRIPALGLYDSVLTFVDVRDVAEVIVRAVEKENNLGARYMAGKHALSLREYYRQIHDYSGIPLPLGPLPIPIINAIAAMLTGLANLTGRPPLWGICNDQNRTFREGFCYAGTKSEQELGVIYTPIETTIAETIDYLRKEK